MNQTLFVARRLASALAACCVAGALLAGGPSAGTVPDVTRGPYLQSGTPTSMVVRWRTSIATESRVLFGASPESLTATVEDGALTVEHGVKLTGLAPGDTVCYAVGDATDVLAGGDADHCFETPPLAGTRQPTRIWVLGDSGTGNDAQRAVRDAYYGYPGANATALWLMLGDNAYPNATDAELQTKLFDVYPEMLRRAPLWPAIGNHNGSSDSPTQTGPYFVAFDLPRNGEAGGQPSGTEAYYSFDWANVHFAVLDSFDTDASADGEMVAWLESDLAATAQDWVVVYFHHPPYSKGSHDSDVETKQVLMREVVVPLLDTYGVDLTLTGHSHSYERSHLIAGHYGTSDTFTEAMKTLPGDGDPNGDGDYAKPVVGPDPFSGIVHAVAGSSGQTSSGALNHPAMVIGLELHGSLVIDVDGQRMDVRFLDRNGLVQDHFAMTKAAGLVVPEASFDVAPSTGTVPLPVAFADLSTNAPDNWSWDLDGDGVEDSALQHPSYNYTEPGRYTVRLIAGNGAGSDATVIEDAVCALATRPAQLAGLVFDDATTLRWQPAPDGAAYEVVRGDLAALRAGAGWAATDPCALGPVTEAVADDTGPAIAGGVAYLVRAVDCAGNARAYDSGGAGQVAPRDVPAAPACTTTR